MKIGVIVDAHGNLAALEAAMAALSAAAPDMVVNLGDLVSGPFDPAGSAEAQMQSGYLTIAGNHERQLQDDSEGAFDVLARPLLKQDLDVDQEAAGDADAMRGRCVRLSR